MLLRVLLDSLLPPKLDDTGTASGKRAVAKRGDDQERRRKELERGWCFELASSVLALLVEHVRSPHSAELWLELHYGLGTATACHRASLAGTPSVSGDGGSKESAECAAVRRTADLLSQAVGHMGGILLREEAIGVKQAALLAEVLVELTSPDLFWQAGTSPGCRRAVVELLAVSLCGLHRQQRLVKSMPRVIRAAAAAPLNDDGSLDGGYAAGVIVTPGTIDTHPALALSRSLLGGVGAERTTNKPPPMRVTRAVALRPLLEACAGPLSNQTDVTLEILVRVIHGTGVGLVFAGDKVSNIGGVGARRGAPHGDSDSGSEAGIEEEDEEEGGIGALAAVAGAEGPSCLPMGPAEGQKVRVVPQAMSRCCESELRSYYYVARCSALPFLHVYIGRYYSLLSVHGDVDVVSLLSAACSYLALHEFCPVMRAADPCDPPPCDFPVVAARGRLLCQLGPRDRVPRMQQRQVDMIPFLNFHFYIVSD